MKKSTQLSLSLLLGATLLTGCAQNPPPGAQVVVVQPSVATSADVMTTQHVRQVLNQDYPTLADNIKIVSQNGRVTLTGFVYNHSQLHAVSKTAASVHGVTAVQNNIIVSH